MNVKDPAPFWERMQDDLTSGKQSLLKSLGVYGFKAPGIKPGMGNGSEESASTSGLAGSWGNTSFSHCKLKYTLHQLRQRESTGQPPNYRTGGLGRKMQSSIFEAWVCVDQHECFSRTSDPMDDWFCWVIDERIALPKERAPEQYVPWGHNGLLKLFDKEDMKIHKSVTDEGERGIAPRARQASGASLGYP
jgi:hypothetical protein